jgi:dipeptidyl aminopeptidase/acylaminoacyl peptidase
MQEPARGRLAEVAQGWISLKRPQAAGGIGEISLSPDASMVAVTLVSTDQGEDSDRASVWVRSTFPQGEWRRLGFAGSLTSLSFSPSGDSLLGLTPEGDGHAAAICDLTGSRFRQVTPPMLSGGRPVWDRQGFAIAWACAPPRSRRALIHRTTQEVFDLDGRGWLDDNVRTPHLWSLDGGDPDVIDVPADCRDLTFAPDGCLIYVSGRREGNSHDFGAQVFRCDLAKGTEVPLTDASLVPAHPLALPDGSVVMTALTSRRGAGCAGALYAIDPDGAAPALLTDPLVCDVAHPLTARAHGLFATAGLLVTIELTRGGMPLVTVDPARPRTAQRALYGPAEVHGVAASAGGVAALVRSGLTEEDVVYAPADQLGRLIGPTTSARPPTYWRASAEAAPQPVECRSQDGETIDAWLVTPPRVTDQVPLVVWLHGGPGAQAGWSVPPDVQRLVQQGCACVYVNPRGSAGRGELFARQLLGRLGEIDVTDVEAVLAAVLEFPEIDQDRVGVHGVSYGGYLAALLWSRRPLFKAAVVERAITSWPVHRDGSDLGLAFTDGYWAGGPPDSQWPDPLREPLRNRSPVLVLTGDRDRRCTPVEARLLFMRLRAAGVPAELATLSDTGHNIGAALPSVRRARANALNDWWAEHLIRPS